MHGDVLLMYLEAISVLQAIGSRSLVTSAGLAVADRASAPSQFLAIKMDCGLHLWTAL